jgi:hypothetical protein
MMLPSSLGLCVSSWKQRAADGSQNFRHSPEHDRETSRPGSHHTNREMTGRWTPWRNTHSGEGSEVPYWSAWMPDR